VVPVSLLVAADVMVTPLLRFAASEGDDVPQNPWIAVKSRPSYDSAGVRLLGERNVG
jgi:hypothetical protein